MAIPTVPGPRFAMKEAPSGDKLRGGYYTPPAVARFVARWVAEAGPRLLEPSCGDGAILKRLVELVGRESVVGVELVPGEAAKARRTGATVVEGDFFTWFDGDRRSVFDGVAGNPPYIRFGNWDSTYRDPALRLMRSVGLRPNKLTNAWVPFVVSSVLAVRQGGRVGLVLPAELLQVTYAAALRSYLVDKCSSITVVSFERLVFAGILQEVVLVLAERGVGPAAIRTIEVTDADELGAIAPQLADAARAQLHEREKWTKYYLDLPQIELLRRFRSDPRLSPLGEWAKVDVGVVSGRNSFFCLTAQDAEIRGLGRWTLPLVSRSAQLRGLVIDRSELDASPDARNRLLTVPEGFDVSAHEQLRDYLAEGAADGVPGGYKCRIRRNWYEVPSVWIPDGFMLRQIHTHPRMVANVAKATSTDTVHRVKLRKDIHMGALAVAAFNSITFAAAEVIGRSYGGGILELEPNEAEELPVAGPDLVPDRLMRDVDQLVRLGRTKDALDLVDDAILVRRLGFGAEDVRAARVAWERLEQRRNRRVKINQVQIPGVLAAPWANITPAHRVPLSALRPGDELSADGCV